jgi:hypothetical protein
MFYIENTVLVYVLFDVEQEIMNDQMFLDINHMNMVLNPMNVYVLHELLNHEKLKNIFHNHYIYMNHYLLLLLHHHLLQLFPISHLFLMMINLKLMKKINLYNIVHQENILNVHLNN